MTVDVLDNQTLNYTGPPISLGSNTLSIDVAGTRINASGCSLVLVQTDSILHFISTGFVSGPVKFESGTLKSSGSPTISGLSLIHI